VAWGASQVLYVIIKQSKIIEKFILSHHHVIIVFA
jgi:hypothetical protein